ncbi:hypothetical protein [Roseovarius sp. M141]|uniref:hypothetical protein n=1 Tax=Roseovarius sp. M141 TaxID=2583806 RepID=UPI0020CD441D|nr:hypothetical protein [Roseovarius sp. M141]MCQ0090452.1 hypothetical protein [Roseovarius sp. M141]
MSRFLFVLYATVITLMPAVFLLPEFGTEAAFFFLTGDAYLYLGIAESSTEAFFSFDGETPTNGFHPLWQSYVWLVARVTSDPMVLMNVAAWSAIGLTLVGVLLLGAAVARATESWLLAGLVSPGVYYLVVGQGLQNLSAWSFFSGMEAGLALALTGLTAYLVVGFKPDERRIGAWLALGVTLGLLMLTRLDDVFVAPAIGLCWLFWSPGQFWRRVPSVLLLGLPPAIFLGLYWAYNFNYIGTLMPVSGAAKGEGALWSNGWVTLVTFFAPLIDLRAVLTNYVGDHHALFGGGFRVAELVFPAIAAGFFILLVRCHFRDQPWAPFIAGMCAAIMVKAGYSFTMVNYWHQAPWYFSFAFGTLSFVTALVLTPAVTHWRRQAPVAHNMVVTLVILVCFLQASQEYLRIYTSQGALDRMAFWDARAETEAALEAGAPGSKVLEFGDGMINFTLERPVRHGFVFAGDPDSLKALQNGSLLSKSYDDNYKILSSYEYLSWHDASTERSSDEIRALLAGSSIDSRVKAELDDFEFEIIHIYEPLSIPFIRLSRR